jgi:hypothetical protein
VQVRDLDWEAIRKKVDANSIRARLSSAVQAMESLLDRADGPGMLFDEDRADVHDRAIKISSSTDDASALWIIGDLHGDLLALEAALAQIQHEEADTKLLRHASFFSATSLTTRDSRSRSLCVSSSSSLRRRTGFVSLRATTTKRFRMMVAASRRAWRHPILPIF